jgi:hypothetical protein
LENDVYVTTALASASGIRYADLPQNSIRINTLKSQIIYGEFYLINLIFRPNNIFNLFLD